jgi:hypothetical protein
MTDEMRMISKLLLRMSHNDCTLHHSCAMLYDAMHRIQYSPYVAKLSHSTYWSVRTL